MKIFINVENQSESTFPFCSTYYSVLADKFKEIEKSNFSQWQFKHFSVIPVQGKRVRDHR